MLFRVCMDESIIIAYDILELAKTRAKSLKKKYPNSKISVAWTFWPVGNKKPYNHSIEVTI